MIGPMSNMIGKSSLTVSILAVFWLVSALSVAAATVTALTRPEKVAPNQQFHFVIQIDDGALERFDELLQLPLQILQLSAPEVRTTPAEPGGQKAQTTIVWVVLAREPGDLVIPPQTLRVDGADASTNEVRLNVESSQAAPEDPSMGFMLQLELPKNQIYQGEVVPLFAKLHIPRENHFSSSPKLIEIEKNDFAVARFPQQADQTQEIVEGRGYHVLTYRTTLSSLRPGDFKLGPATQTIVAEIPVFDKQNPSMFTGQTEPRNISIKSLSLPVKILPLPTEGKPESFSGAVGDFSMTATASPTELTVGDPLAVDIIIAGSGNFDSLVEPVLTAPHGWKAYPAKRYSIEGQIDQNQVPTLERKIGFSQVFIPEAVHTQFPPFEMSFFSLETKKYVILRTDSIPLNMKPAPPLPGAGTTGGESSQDAKNVPPPAMDPQAVISDIVINPPAKSRWLAPASERLLYSRTFWAAQAVPVGLFILASLLALFRRLREARQAGRAGELRAAWATFEREAKADAGFLRAAAQFIHSAKAGEPVVEPELKGILDRYQTANFAVDKNVSSVSSSDRRKIRSELSRLLNQTMAKVTFVAVLLLACGHLNAQSDKSPTSSDEVYQDAVAELEQRNYIRAQHLAESLTKKNPPELSSEIFQLIGHARYRQEDIGRAALWYQRAQLLDTRSPELKQNVRHLYEKQRYLSFSEGPVLRQWSLSLTQNQWLVLAAVGGWLILLPLAWWILGRRHGGLVIAIALIGFCIALPASTMAALRPLGSERVRDISVVILPDTMAYTAATTTSGIVIDLPMGSQIRVLEKRGRWVYVEIPDLKDKLLGWVEEAAITPLWTWDEDLVP